MMKRIDLTRVEDLFNLKNAVSCSNPEAQLNVALRICDEGEVDNQPLGISTCSRQSQVSIF